MKFANTIVAVAASLAVGAVLFQMSSESLGFTQGTPAVPDGELRLNEIQNAPWGSAAGVEWIELAQVGGKDLSLAGYQLENHKGDLLYQFPAVSLGSGWTVLVTLGPVQPGLASRDYAPSMLLPLFTGLGQKDVLDDTQGGVVLRSPTGAIVDAMFYGPTAPPSGASGYKEAVATNEWVTGDFYDTSFDGPAPNFWGGSIGRKKKADDANSASDWSGDGGADGALRSPGKPNTLDVFNTALLIQRANEVVDGAFFAYGMTPAEFMRFSVTHSDATHVVTTDNPGQNYSVTADYTFAVDDQASGLGAIIWGGSLAVNFTESAARAYQVHTVGMLTSAAGDSLSVDQLVTRSGFGTGSHLNDQLTDFTLTLAGTAYPLLVVSHQVSTIEADDTMSVTLDRTEQRGIGDTPKSFTLAVTRKRLTPNLLSESFDWTMPDPPVPQFLGEQTPVVGTLNLVGTATRSDLGEGAFNGVIDSMKIFRSGKLFAEILPTNPGVLSGLRTSGSPGDIIGNFQEDLTLPLMLADSDGWIDPNQQPLVLSGASSTQATILNGKLSAIGQASSYLAGGLAGTRSRYIDPPLAQVVIGAPPRADPGRDYVFYGNGGGSGSGGGPGWDGATGVAVASVGVCGWMAWATLEAPPIAATWATGCTLVALLATEW